MSETETRIFSYQIAENLSMKKVRQHFLNEPFYSSNYELFYQRNNGFIYIVSFGIVGFAGIPEQERKELLDSIRPFSVNPLPDHSSEDFLIKVQPNEKITFSYNHLVVPELTPGIIRISMLQVAQSLALDFYMDKAGDIFEETAKMSTQLEKAGDLKASRKNILKFVGRTMNTKNRIIDDLYVIDSPPSIWDNEQLSYIYEGLSNTFDIKPRFRELEYIIKNIESNLGIFIELAESRQSKWLEIIIILLILFEVVHVIIKETLFS